MTFSIVARIGDAFGVAVASKFTGRDCLDWAGEANFETRMTPDGIDSRVLQALREAVG